MNKICLNSIRALLVLLLPAIILPGMAQTLTYTAGMLEGEPPGIDGSLDEAAWAKANWQGGFVQREPYDGKPPTYNTDFAVLYDNEALYVGIRCYDDEPEKIDRRMSRRDQLDGDVAGIHIDSYFDRRTAFAFMVNAGGVKTDYLISNDFNDDYSWDPVWYVKTRTDSAGWTAEMKIPLTQLRFARAESYLWGVNVGRVIYRFQETSLWKPIPADATGWVSQFGNLEGIAGIQPKREVELLPYAMGKLETYEEESGNPYADGLDLGYNIGLDGKVAVTNDLTMNFTVNPDFGQVEADPSVVNLSAFETFYSERRPFFVEGNNIYNFKLTGGDGSMARDNLFYSRRIGRQPHYEPETGEGEYLKMPDNTTILGAFKLSGKTGNGWSIGVMESLTREERASITSGGEESHVTVEPWTNYFNGRLQKDFKQGNTIVGGMFTATNRFISDTTLEYLPAQAYSGGVDFQNYWKNHTYYLRVKGAFSYLQGTREAMTELQESPVHNFQRPDAPHLSVDSSRTSLAGHGGVVEFGKQGNGHWNYTFWVTWRSPGLDLNDMGYLRQGDIIQQVVWAQYHIWEPFSIFRNMRINFNQYSGWDFGGEYIYNGLNTNVNTQFKNYYSTGAGVEYSFPSLDRYELRGGPAILKPGGTGAWLNVETDTRKKLSAEFGGFMYWGSLQSNRTSEIWLGAEYRPVNALNISLRPLLSTGYEELQYVETIDGAEQKYIMARIDKQMLAVNLRINLSITPDLSIQYWGQPFVFAGDYSAFKKAAETTASDYNDRFSEFTADQIFFDPENDSYEVDEDLDGITDYSFDNPDFKVYEFRSNLVIRWEYVPGSTIFLVWSQGRMDEDGTAEFDFAGDMDNLFDIHPRNIFLVKFSYRISI